MSLCSSKIIENFDSKMKVQEDMFDYLAEKKCKGRNIYLKSISFASISLTDFARFVPLLLLEIMN